jgi:heme-degrading monooxygenase HmoA
VIVALSRFRVANAMTGAVSQAFVHRPRLVDDAPGFLGLEVFTDAKDSAIYYLATRWTDVASFRTWHRSEEHHRSHSWIPKGLKLEAAYTKVVIAERIAPGAGAGDLETLAADAAPVLARFLAESETIVCALASRDGTIREANGCLARAAGSTRGALSGRPLASVMRGSALDEALRTGARSPGVRAPLEVLGGDGTPTAYACHVDVHPDHVLVIGEPAGDGGALAAVAASREAGHG